MKIIKVSFKIRTSDYESGILEKEFRQFINELDTHGQSEMFDFRVKELRPEAQP